MIFRFKSVFILIAALLVSACSSVHTYVDQYPSADERLNYLLGLYKSNLDQGKTCQEMWSANNPVIDCERLLVEMDRLVAEYPNDTRVLMANAVLQYNNGRPDRAQPLLDSILGQSGPHPEAAVLRARISLEQGNHIRAKQMLEREIVMSPYHTGLRSALAAVYYAEGDYAKSRSILRSAVGDTSQEPWKKSYHHGLLAEAEENWQAACQLYRLALEQKPGYPAATARLISITEHIPCVLPVEGEEEQEGAIVVPLAE